MDRWGVVALADEPAALIAAFVAHHLDLGADEVHICLDRPNPEARDLLAGVPGAVLHDAGEDGWAFSNGFRPVKHLGRQKYHASRMLAETKLDWLVHCDADEFVLPTTGESVAEVLSAVRPGASWVKIGVAERTHLDDLPAADIFTGVYRLPWWGFEARGGTIYDDAALALLNKGLCGHNLGKCAVRSGRELFVGVHRPMREWNGGGRDVPYDGTAKLALLHYDGLTELHYALKMMRRALNAMTKNPPSHAPQRQLQFEAMAGAAHNARALHAQWLAAKVIDAGQARALEREGVLARFDPQIAARTARVVGAVDLSPAGFDRALLAHEAALFARAAQSFGFDPTPLVAA